MKGSNIFLIVITSIITFIGLVCSKLYEKYVKKNILVQIMLYGFWTLLALRLFMWAAKPLVPTGLPRFLQGITIDFGALPDITPMVCLIIFSIIIIGVCLFFKDTINKIR